MTSAHFIRRMRFRPLFQGLSMAMLLACGLVITDTPAFAQAADAPVVRQVEAAPAPAPAASQPARQTEPAPIAVGDITRALLAAQADGRRAGSELGIPGPVASASWKRYVDSFTYPIPELFEARLEKSTSN